MSHAAIEVVSKEDGTMRGLTGEVPENDSDVPFNLQTLRRHLSQVVLAARRALSENVALRQKMLEQSVYNVAVERMKHQAEQMDSLGLPSKGLPSNDLRGWMGKWHQKLQTRIQAEVENLVIEERVLGACVLVSLSAPRSCSLSVQRAVGPRRRNQRTRRC